MTADLARITYDPTRQYRSVLFQQGRVTLEADGNEAERIGGETLRLETIDIIGPTGTPDDGYKVSGSGGGISIGAGILYLGGWRLALGKPVDIAKQPDWLDRPATPFTQGNAVVALLISEQSVCAIEDQALREVALGGPDSAARLRLMQHFLLESLDGDDCAAGAKAIAGMLEQDGVTIDPATLQLVSAARLQAGFVPGPGSTDPCSPAAVGGYLGADNQMVRVTVIAYDGKEAGTLLWGWNNASLLYRAGVTDPLTLTLTNVPVDEEHAPQLGQAVEILRSQADLGDGNFIADPQGFVTTLAQAYSFDTGEIVLNDALPAEYQSDKNPLFVRLWQATVTFNQNEAVALDSVSGITVTVTLPALPGNIALRPFWHFAVRPSTPVQIYPQRYLEAPQPPDGPRQWITDLAVVQASVTTGAASGVTVLQDCRVKFNPLTGIQGSGKCCGVVLDPDDVAAQGGLQAVVDKLAGTQATVSLLAGSYPLDQPLVLTAKHSGLTLAGCSGGTILSAAGKDLSAFLFGLIVLEQAADVTLRGLEFHIPAVSGTAEEAAKTATCVGVLAAAAPRLTVESCTFDARPGGSATFGACLLVVGAATSLAVRRNNFVCGRFVPGGLLFGVLATVANANATTALNNAEICDNLFERFNVGLLAFSQFGLVRCNGNRVVGCGAGLVFAASNLGAASEVARLAQDTVQDSPTADLRGAVANGLQAPLLANAATNAAPFMAKLPATGTAPAASDIARQVLVRDLATRGTATWQALSQGFTADAAAPAPVGAAAAPPAPAPAPAADTTAPAAPSDADHLQVVNEVAVAAELAGYNETPVLHIAGNDVALVATQTDTAGIGIAVIFSPRDESGTVLLTANRVATPDRATAAASILFPTLAAVTGNVLVQAGKEAKQVSAGLAVLAEKDARIEVTANVVQYRMLIAPARTNSAAMTSWEFLNTTG